MALLGKKPKYIKQDPITHVLTRPDMYVGSKAIEYKTEYIYNEQTGIILKKEILVSPALVRTFIEILSNAIDNLEREPKMSYIRVNINSTGCEIINDGSWIPITINKQTDGDDMYNHTLIFGHLLSGSNYDDTEKRYTSGRNGLGAKLTNILSKKFNVTGIDPEEKLIFSQTWSNNMKTVSPPIITKTTRVKGQTAIKWEWDCKWFGIKEISSDIKQLFNMYVYNTAMITGLNVSLNNIKLLNTVSKYFIPFIDTTPTEQTELLRVGDEITKVFVTASPTREHEVFSFVNGIHTKNGGRHVTAWIEAICRPIIEKLKTKKGELTLTLKDIKPFFRFLIITRVANPEFDGQEKNELKAPLINATSINSLQVNKILKWRIGLEIKALIVNKEHRQVSKAIAAAHTKHPHIDGYDKANNAGTKKSKDCILIICEGLSAKTFAVEGINHGLNGRKGRDWFGIYPLRGKLLNTRNATSTSIRKNTVITNLIKLLNLDYSQPNNLEKIAYGKICILTDADVDGIHIEGLLLNFFHSLFPKILIENRVMSMKTPILRLTHNNKTTYLFDEKTINNIELEKNTTIKYFKGLGTTNPADVKKIFGIKLLHFSEDPNIQESFEIAFLKNKSEQRKLWLAQYSPLTITDDSKSIDDYTEQNIKFPISQHLNYELIKYFYDNCKRSIPNIFDGLKESQRKIIFSAKKKQITKEIKVAQFGAYVAENTNYHHGEDNLFNTIVKMAQSFTGTNNLPLFVPEGMFGTRLEGGDDASAPRYIFTKLQPYFNLLFPPIDDPLLIYNKDDGANIEPTYYVPIIPLILINGCIGIGTGWMCSIPQFSPKDIIKICELWMNTFGDRGDLREQSKHRNDKTTGSEIQKNCQIYQEKIDTLCPWYQHFSGTIESSSDTTFITRGKIEKISERSDERREGTMYKITELPIGMWNNKFKKIIETSDTIINYKDHSTPTKVHFIIEVSSTFNEENFLKKLQTNLNLNNIVVFNEDGNITKISLQDIFKIWGVKRLQLNNERKIKQLSLLKRKLHLIECQIKFIQSVIQSKIILTNSETTISHIINTTISPNEDIEKMLLDLPIRSLTKEKQKNLESSLIKIKKERDSLSLKTNSDLWFEDISELKKCLNISTSLKLRA